MLPHKRNITWRGAKGEQFLRKGSRKNAKCRKGTSAVLRRQQCRISRLAIGHANGSHRFARIYTDSASQMPFGVRFAPSDAPPGLRVALVWLWCGFRVALGWLWGRNAVPI